MGILRDKLKERCKQQKRSGGFSVEDVKFLNKELRSMRAALSMVADLPRGRLDVLTMNRACEWRELSFDIDAILARGGGNHEPAIDPGRSKGKGLVEKMTNYSLIRRGKTRRHIADEIRNLKALIKEITERHNTYRSVNPVVTSIDPRFLFVDTDSLVGIAETRDVIIRRLTEGAGVSYQQLKIVSLVGLAGLGKTTLAYGLYQRLRLTFQCKAFVSLSLNPDMKYVLFSIFNQLGIAEYRDTGDEASWDQSKAIGELKNFLQNKRYLIVIDDIWDTESWVIIKHAMVDNNLGSRIITTTRRLDVAEEIGGAYKVRPLSDKSSRILFYRTISGTDECPNNELAEMSDNILKKCGGVPFFIIAIASSLARRGDEPHEVTDCFIGPGFGHNLEAENIRTLLSLSYYNLPHYLKPCLLYASLFPDGYVIRRDILVWMWIAECFIQEKQGCNLFEVGQSYIDGLLNSSMIQEVDISDDGDDGTVKYCYVPTMVLYFIRYLSCEENFVCIMDGSQEQRPRQEHHARRLSLQNSAMELKGDQAIDPSRLRSLTAFGTGINLMRLLSNSKLLRVVVLEGTDLQNCNLKTVKKLLHLRYLGLRGTLTADLPKEVGYLMMLMVLDLKGTKLKELPSTVTRLIRLMCLYVECTTKLPQGMGNLTSLEELSKISIIESPTFAEEVSSLVELRVLGIVLQQDDDVSESLQKGFLESLCNLHKLQTLRIFGGGGGELNLENFVTEGWVPPPALRSFITVKCWFSALPTWITSVNLSELQIGVRQLSQEGLQILGRLQELRFLQLAVESMMEKLAVDAYAFPRLRVLRLRCGTCLVFRLGSMPAIRTLEFVLDMDIASGQFNWGLNKLCSLEQVSTTLRHGNDSAAEVSDAEAALENAMHCHPNRPDLKITKVALPSQGDQQDQEQEDANEENSSAESLEIRECSA
ncbi:unnamed protein product [Urochloa humidicola]